ncbi:hypothetical protein SAMN04488589_1533 [Methanolobus vulcani]|uniref:Uncharacterized protein n=1 Tax=Methanolobus vulcani TaxID=38026 RepID=A0A7Z7AWM8_9EURY|nr:hypothetical protein [Methanolobus vulcani]SDF85410.1 hypothetical protein SAMN04488589_1533 [Methanolobus vulcani]
MVMTTGSFGYFEVANGLENIEEIKNKTNNFGHTRNEDEQQLNSVIRLDGTMGNLGNGIHMISGTVYDQYIKTSTFVNRNGTDNDGLPAYEIERRPHVDVRWGQFWILNNGMLLTRIKNDRPFISQVVSQALGCPVYSSSISIRRIAEDYTNNWLGGIVDRDGNWQKGTLYGDDLRSDDCVGSEFANCTKNQVGSFTQYFGGTSKFKVTKDGTIVVYTNLDDDRDSYVKFVLNELHTYFITEDTN